MSEAAKTTEALAAVAVEAEALPTKMVQLQNKDGVIIEISFGAAQHSELVKDTLSCCMDNDDDEQPDIASMELKVEGLPIDAKTLESVACFLSYYAHTPMDAIPDPAQQDIPETFDKIVPNQWYQTYVSALGIDDGDIWRIRSAAAYLGIDALVNLVNAFVAYNLLGKNDDEINNILRLASKNE
jgi:hypothetical protein